MMRSLLLLIPLALLSPAAQAGWWIFGQSGNEVSLSYLTINGVSFDETGPRITVYSNTLKDGQAVVKGRASVRKGKIGLVEVTADGGDSWLKATLSAAGDFEQRFPAESGKVYKVLVRVTDTSGKTNDWQSTAKELSVSERDVRSEVKGALDALVAAYQAEDPTKFMALVAEDFAGDSVVLDRAVRTDFTNFDGIQLSYTISNLASSDGGLVAVTIAYRRMLISTRSGQVVSDSGTTQFVFRTGDSVPKVYSMKNPLIFGVSDASEVATGTQPGNDAPVIAVDDTGAVTTVDPGTLGTEGGGSGVAVAAANATIPAAQGFRFSDASVIGNPPIPNGADIAYNAGGPGFLVFRTGTKYRAIGLGTNVDNITSASDQSSGYTTSAANDNAALAATGGYEFYTTGQKYGVLSITTINAGVSIVIRYKYQPSGARTF
ncbi:MAG: hypothetical protein HY928_07055 [Elusimicrobia bacterium]|nr:hypothetical protein [Elusimicrobiota bacterium]